MKGAAVFVAVALLAALSADSLVIQSGSNCTASARSGFLDRARNTTTRAFANVFIDACRAPTADSLMATSLRQMSGVAQAITEIRLQSTASCSAQGYVLASGVLDVSPGTPLKTLCEVVAPNRTFAKFEMANCATYSTAIAGVVFNAQTANDSAFFEARCGLGNTASTNRTLLEWSTGLNSRGVNISSSQVTFCSAGIATFNISMREGALRSLQPVCGTVVPSTSTGLPGWAVAVIIVGCVCVLAAAACLVIFCFWRRSKRRRAAQLPPKDVSVTLPVHVPVNAAVWRSASEAERMYLALPSSSSREDNTTRSHARPGNATLSYMTTDTDTGFGSLLDPLMTHITSARTANSTAAALKVIEHQIALTIKSCGGLLFNRYHLLPNTPTRVGGQGMVHYATSGPTGTRQFAVKLFAIRECFDAEIRLYSNESLFSVLPPVDDAYDNEDGRWLDPIGRPLPPAIIMEKGEPLDEYVRRAAPDALMTLALTGHLMEAVAQVHAAGLVHRDIKPSNTLFIPSSNTWTLMDFGSAAPAGELAHMSITVRYAAPETAAAYEAGMELVVCSPAVDVWALGVICWELFTKSGGLFPYGTPVEKVLDALTGREPLPWENEESPTYAEEMQRLGRMRRCVLSMLHRDPEQRAQLEDVRAEWNHIFYGGSEALAQPRYGALSGRR